LKKPSFYFIRRHWHVIVFKIIGFKPIGSCVSTYAPVTASPPLIRSKGLALPPTLHPFLINRSAFMTVDNTLQDRGFSKTLSYSPDLKRVVLLSPIYTPQYPSSTIFSCGKHTQMVFVTNDFHPRHS
jgi:hypothetical protein